MVEAFAVASGKGGTGKTTSTLALGMALADTHDVTVIDADTGMANLLFHTGLDDADTTLHDLLLADADATVEDAVYERFGLSVVPCGTSLTAFSEADPTRLRDVAARLREMGVELYPHRTSPQRILTQQAIDQFESLEQQDPEAAENLTVTVSGRIRRVNIKGKVSFMHIEDESGRLQLFLRVNDMDEQVYNAIKEKLIEMDDFVEASGMMMRTRAGEVSVRVQQLQLLSKALSPLPVIKQEVRDDGTVEAEDAAYVPLV